LNKGRLDTAAQKGGLFVKHKRKAILILVVIMLMGVMLTGCRDRDNNTNSGAETNQSRPALSPEQQRNQAPPQPGGGPNDPNWVPPPYEPQNP
jgi:hypothetical protein